MTTINASLFISGTTEPLVGYIRVITESLFADVLGNLNVPVAKDFILEAGAVSFDLDPSDIAKVSYRFQIWQLVPDTTTTDPEGVVTPVVVPDILLKEFAAIIPYSATALRFADLAVQAGVRYDQQDAALLTLSRYLQTSDTFWQALIQQVWNLKGDWDSAQYYKRGDVVVFNGSAYQYIQAIASVGNLPTNVAYWRLLVSKGDTGTGTDGNDTAYGVSWNGSLDAPSRNAVYNKVQTLATNSQLATYAPSADPVLTGNPTAPTQTTGNRSTRLATTAFVGAEVDLIGQVPVGGIIAWITNSAPNKWILCDGRAISRTTYSALYVFIGTTYGAGDGSTTFNVPDYRGRVPVGRDTSTLQGKANRVLASWGDTLGLSGGTETYTLTIPNLPTGNYFVYVPSGGNAAVPVGTTSISHNGTSTPFSIMQPGLTINWIMYTGV